MPIQVTCPNCLKRFQVSDKFAGKTGPCPSCKKQIKVPDASEEVIIHAPDDGVPKDSQGVSVLKPLKRTETDVTRKGILITSGAILLALAGAVGLRMSGDTIPVYIQALGAFFLAPPLIWAGYSFVRDSELEPYVGSELRNRVLMLSGIFAALWLLYAFVPNYVLDLDSPSEMNFLAFGLILAIMIGLGALASAATFELEFVNGLTHAGLYFIVAVMLALISGLKLATSG
ncbi:MAG: hypothetical protein OSA98_00625 [Rubripirellula sp.]|jgi:hypothetical protein|nr:hypothetical protein [Rubripirellula sp.]|tara:strand:- start:474 stop:1163 length:690 start_codon:yes stop_codon:yes gene_type:complete